MTSHHSSAQLALHASESEQALPPVPPPGCGVEVLDGDEVVYATTRSRPRLVKASLLAPVLIGLFVFLFVRWLGGTYANISGRVPMWWPWRDVGINYPFLQSPSEMNSDEIWRQLVVLFLVGFMAVLVSVAWILAVFGRQEVRFGLGGGDRHAEAWLGVRVFGVPIGQRKGFRPPEVESIKLTKGKIGYIQISGGGSPMIGTLLNDEQRAWLTRHITGRCLAARRSASEPS